ncbi:retron St85 family effector protein [Aliivibrio fischeri]|uniref:retron St85 family effector protein n=1 Tax=Aliivibrio fischeri TaxID=668 RepID=UPI0007C5780B|nr:retron St85 family effector protein [Aliivibrio fischeri]
MSSIDIAEQFLSSVDTAKLSLKNLPNYIFFCGGGLDGEEVTEEEISEGEQVKSLRSAVLNHLKTKEKDLYQDIILAESFHDWLEDANINNLIDFELLLAGLASAVILIVEGPGAHAELGAFSVMPEISSKLITIFNTNNFVDGKRTFVEWGPIKFLENNEKTLLPYEWNVNYIVEDNAVSQFINNDGELKVLTDLISMQLVDDIKTKNKKTSPFSDKNHSDLCLLVADLIYIFSALKLREIKIYINDHLKIKLDEKRLKEYLYSLKKLGLIKEKSAGAKYFLPTDKNKGFVKYHFNKTEGVDNKLSANFVKTNLLLKYIDDDKERSYVLGIGV